jgi:hypothetical protein
MRKNQAILLYSVAVLVLAAAGTAFAFRQNIRDSVMRAQREPVPAAVTREEFAKQTEVTAIEKPVLAVITEPAIKQETAKPAPTTPSTVSTTTPGLPTQMNLKLPFFPQAPFRIWDEIHEDACEEASILMVQAYLNGEKTVSLEEIDRRILKLVDYQNRVFGDFRSTNAEQTVAMMKDELKLTGARVLPVKTADDIRTQIAKGRPVVIPGAGRLLNNPNFRHGGPLYHMLVIKGYTSDGKFVTHDPGTRLGEDYIYTEEVIMESLHDYNGGDVLNGAKVMIVVE